MKKILFIISLIPVFLFGQVKQQYSQYGSKWKRMQVDSAFRLPMLPISTKDFFAAAPDSGQIYYSPSDSTIKWHTGFQWRSAGAGGGGTDNTNLGSGYRLLVPSSQGIKTLFSDGTLTIDSTSNSNGITHKVDTFTISTRAFRDKLKDSLSAAGWNQNIYNSDGTINSSVRTVSLSTNQLKIAGSGTNFYTYAPSSVTFNIDNASSVDYSFGFGSGNISLARSPTTSGISSLMRLEPTYAELNSQNTSGPESFIRVYPDSIRINAQDGFITMLGLSQNVGTKTLRYDPATGKVTYHDIPSGYTTLSQFVDETAWRVFYSNGSGDVTPQALGSDNTVWKSTGASSAPEWAKVKLNELDAADGTNTINNVDFVQEWQWNSLTSGTGLKLTSTATGATSNTQKVLEVETSGANANASQLTYAIYGNNIKTGTSSINIGVMGRATSGATAIGVRGNAFSGTALNIGVDAQANNALAKAVSATVSSTDGMALYGLASNANNSYGLNVSVTGTSSNTSWGAYIENTVSAGTQYALFAKKTSGAATDNIAGYFDASGGTNNIAILINAGEFRLPEVAAPGTPPAGFATVYQKTDGKLYMKNDAGTEYDLTATGGGGGALNDLTDVVITAAATGEYLRYDGANWVDATIQAGDIPDLSATYVPVAGTTSITGKKTFTGGFATTSYNVITSGSSSTIGDNITTVIFDPASDLSAYTLTMPASPADGQWIYISTGSTIAASAAVSTSFTLSPNTGQSIYGAVTMTQLLGGDEAAFQYKSSNTTWYRKK